MSRPSAVCARLIRFGLMALMGLPANTLAEASAPLQDPTRPSGWRAADTSGNTDNQQAIRFQLQGVFSHAGKRTAMISGQRVAEGDRVGDAEVIQIGVNTVTLRVDGEPMELAAVGLSVKSPAESPEVRP